MVGMNDERLNRFKVLGVSVLGTLFDLEQGIIDYIMPLAEQAGVPLAPPAMLEAFSFAEEKQISLSPELTFPEILTAIYLDLAGALGLPTEGGEAEGFGRSIPNWPVFPEVVDALARLGRHYRMVAFTNSDNISYWSIARALGEPFAEKVTSEDVGVGKPNSLMYAYLRGQQSVHGFNRSDILLVSQSQYHDIELAHRLGFATAWIERRPSKDGAGATPLPAQPVEPDFHFKNMAELADAADAAFRI